MALSDDIRLVLHRHRESDTRGQVLAVLCALRTDRGALRDWLTRYAPEEVRSFASDDVKWTTAVKDARRHLSKSPSAVRRDTARRIITHSVRGYWTSRPSDDDPAVIVTVRLGAARARKARLVAAVIGSMILDDPRGWDTAIYNLEDISSRLGVAPNTAAAWLKVAVDEGVISLRGRTRNGERRVALRSWPRSHKPTAVEKAASASILDGAPDALASWVLSAGHPGWHYDDELSPAAWEGSVLWAAGLKKPRGRMLKTLAPLTDPMDLDLRLDAVARAAEAAERRAAEKAQRATEGAAHAALKKQVRDVLVSWGWTPASWPKDPAGRAAAIAAFVNAARSATERIPNAPPLLMATIERGLRKHAPDRADDALAYIRKDIFADDNRLDPH